MFDLQNRTSRFVALALAAVTTFSALTFIPAVPSQAASGAVTNGVCSASVSETSGVSVYNSGNICFVAFKSTGVNYTWTAPAGVTNIDYAVIAGGGGGGSRSGGGGGAGGLLSSNLSISSGSTVAISVGAGGAGAPSTRGLGANGSNSTLAVGATTVTAIGGGGGSDPSSGNNATVGGSGGGAAGSRIAASGTAGQGYAGASGQPGGYCFTGSADFWCGGGGGGAGAAATNVPSNNRGPGIGGIGATISWLAKATAVALTVGDTSHATLAYFAGGGTGGSGGQSDPSNNQVAGPLGGGGYGIKNSLADAGNGLANTGGGGGGSGYGLIGGQQGAGGSGGSGVVVIRYLIPILSYNASDINSYESSVGTAVNDLSAGGANDGTVTAGATGTTATYDATKGAWIFAGGTAANSPHVRVNNNISTDDFATSGITIDFEANFGSTAEAYESIIGFKDSATADGFVVSRHASSNELLMQIIRGGASEGYCGLAEAIPTSDTAIRRWTIVADGTTCSIYKDGVSQASYYTNYGNFTEFKMAPGRTLNENFIGKSTLGGGEGFSGSVRSVRLYAGAFTPAQIGSLTAKTVTFNSNGSGAAATTALTSGTLRLPAALTRSGYTFSNWYSDANATILVGAAGATYTPTATTTLYAGWTLPNKTATFDANGGAGTMTAQVTNVATSLTANTFTRAGYMFAGWNTVALGGGTAYANQASYAFTADVTLYAQWTALPNKTVIFDANSGTGSMSNQVTHIPGSLTSNTFTRNGFSFAGWNTQANGGGTSYADAASYAFTADVTLYAQWSALPNKTVTFNNNSGSGTMTAQVTNVATNLTANTFTRSGYTFAGWNTVALGGGTAYANQASYAFTADTTLYAQWTALPNKTVTFDANNGSGTMASQATNVAANLTVNTFTRSGYTFAGWNTVANGSGTSYADAASYAFTADATLFAQWTAINYGITYNASTATSGAVPTDSANYNIGNSVAILGNSGSLTRTGYTFAGWTVASDGSGTVLVSGSTLTFSAANINVYAKWTANTYTISYNVNGATGAQANTSDSYTTGGSAVTLSAVGTMAKTGHTFNGWATTANGSPIAGTYTTISNVTLYALWSINTITVTYDKGTAGGSSLSAHSFTSFPGSAGTGNYGTRLNLSNSVDSAITFNSETYTFVGWNDGSSIYAPGTSFLLQNNVTMTAIWALTHAVRYTFNGGTAANSTSSVDAECTLAGSRCVDLQAITLNAAPTRDGYTFAGWRDQSGADFAAGASVSVLVTSYLFYAQWTPIAYTVTYVPNGGGSTPTETSKNIGDTFTVANAPSRTGYDFGGWFDGSVTYGAGATYTVGSASVSFSAQWIAHVYTINYDWNGGSGTAVADANYTVGTSGITLPSVTDQVKDGYTFGGWATTNGGIALASPFVPTASATLYAVWGSGSYNITYAPELGTVATTNLTVSNGNTITLETPTRQGFVFDGWFTAQTGGSRVGSAGSSFTPSASRTLHARWTQASIFGIPVGNLNRLGSVNASNSASSTYSGSNANSSVAVNVPSGALPNGTAVNIDMISDNTHANGLINGDKSFILSVAVSWLASDGTVPNTASGKSISVTLNNPGIKAGALIYSIQGTSVVLLGTATQDGTVTFELTQDPGIYVVATSPSAPQNASATATTSSATISWQAPSSDGGSPITGYTVTLNTGATCTTTVALNCTISSLSAGTTYTYTVTATNSVGTSPTASGSFNSSAANRTVTFDSNGGSGAMVNQITNVATALTSNAFTKTGYNFAGWNTAANGSGNAYANGATYAFSADVTLYAQWTLIPVNPPAPTPSTPQYERPDAPTSVVAKISGTSITVSWSAPVNTGGTAIVNYRVVSTSGMACITNDTSCTFNDVNKDVRYSFTVTASNGYRDSLPSAASNHVLIPSVLLNQNALVASGSQGARGDAVKIVVTGGSTGASIIYEVANGTAKGCAIDGEGWLTATASGTCLVTVTMLGDFTYKPISANTTVSFLCKLVAQAPLTVNASGSTSVSLSTTGGSGSGAVSYSVTDGTADCTLVDNVIKVAKTGTCVVVATKAADDVYESATSAPLTVNVKPVITSSTPVVKVSPIKHVVTVAPNGNPVLLGSTISKPIIFGADSAKLDAGDIRQLKSVAAYVKAKNLSVLVTGFAKASTKSTLIEKLLATSRAKAVATYLRKLGVNVDISYAGYGAYNKTKPSINDRRVELRWVAND